MHLSSPMSLLLIITITILSIQIPPSISLDDAEKYKSCNTTFRCGDLEVDLGYPFSGSTRPSYCGHPGFNLICSTGSDPIITINSIDYRIINVDNATQTIKIASSNYYETVCPTNLINITIDLSLFNYTSSVVNLTLLYNCPSSYIPPNQDYFTCLTDTIFVILPDYNFPTPTSGCTEVFVTISSSEDSAFFENPTNDTLLEAIDAGFELQWKIENEVCNECIYSGGGCGWDTSADAFACYCEKGAFPSTCGAGKKSSNKTALIAGVSAGATGIVLLLLGCWIFVIKKHRKINAVKSVRKDSSPPPSTIVASTPIIDFSRSIPSYPYSKSDLEEGSTYFGTQIFSYEELMEATENFHPSKQLGDGGFGTVYYGELKDGRVVAVKRLYENNFKRVEQFMNEVEIITRLQHKNLVKLYGCTSKRSRELLLVYEYISNGTVADHLHKNKTSSDMSWLLSWPVRLSIAIETAEALAYLHRSDTIHRDVKTNNILLEDDFRVKVADFGLSRLFPTDVTHVSTAPQGTPGYIDPEYYQCYSLTDKSDVYSFGVVLVELLSSLQAVDTNRHKQEINLASMAVNKIVNHKLNELVDPCLGFENDDVVRKAAASVATLACQCLQHEREMRPTMVEVLKGLREIEKEQAGSLKAEVVDICVDDDIGLLKSVPPPFSPDYIVTEKQIMFNRTM